MEDKILTLVDNILKEFFSQYSVNDLLKDIKKFDNKRIISYKIKEKTYRGTLYNYRSCYPEEKNQLIIKLSHNQIHMQKTKDCSEWIIVDKNYLNNMEELKNLQEKLNCKIKFICHYFQERIIIEFLNLYNNCILKIILKHGHPNFEDERIHYTQTNSTL